MPWRMTAADYLAALAAADGQGAVLPQDPYPPRPTPWDPALRRTLDRERHIVHQERLLAGLIESGSWSALVGVRYSAERGLGCGAGDLRESVVLRRANRNGRPWASY